MSSTGETQKELPQRLYDLVRYCRAELHEEGLITDSEYAEMCAWGSDSARRLEDYDATKAENVRFRVALTRIEQMPWPNSQSPYALIAREALKAPSVESGLPALPSASDNQNSAVPSPSAHDKKQNLGEEKA